MYLFYIKDTVDPKWVDITFMRYTFLSSCLS